MRKYLNYTNNTRIHTQDLSDSGDEEHKSTDRRESRIEEFIYNVMSVGKYFVRVEIVDIFYSFQILLLNE